MIQIIAGKKGSGKTKRLIDMTNQTAKDATNDVIFIDNDNRYMFDIDHKVRFINASDYHASGVDRFVGFISGILSQNFDVGTIFIDSFAKLVNGNLAETEVFFKAAEELSAKNNVNFVLSVSADPAELPDFARTYLL